MGSIHFLCCHLNKEITPELSVVQSKKSILGKLKVLMEKVSRFFHRSSLPNDGNLAESQFNVFSSLFKDGLNRACVKRKFKMHPPLTINRSKD